MILQVIWGEITTFDGSKYKDCKLKGTASSAWNWGLTNTHHSPGIQIADLEDLIDENTTTVILSRGMNDVLKTMPETMDFLKAKGLTVHHLKTKEAVILYNTLVKDLGSSLVGLIHSTC
jgi:hypothetical protein